MSKAFHLLILSVLWQCLGAGGLFLHIAWANPKLMGEFRLQKMQHQRQVYYKTQGSAPQHAYVFLHGLSANPKGFVLDAYKQSQALFKKNSIIVFPMGSRDLRNRHSLFGWDAGNCCVDSKGDDAFFSQIFAWLASFDPASVTLIGYSNGAHMVHKLACDHASKIDYAVSISGTFRKPADDQLANCKKGSDYPSILMIHNLDDPVVRFSGGKSSLGTYGLPLVDVFKSWKARKQCGDTKVTRKKVMNTVLRCRESRCNRGQSDLILCTRSFGGHSWFHTEVSNSDIVSDYYGH